MHTFEAPFANMKNGMLKVARNPFILGRSGTQYVAMVTKLLSSYCGAPFVESYCKESNIYEKNWLRYLLSLYLIKIRLCIRRHHLANLHIIKT